MAASIKKSAFEKEKKLKILISFYVWVVILLFYCGFNEKSHFSGGLLATIK